MKDIENTQSNQVSDFSKIEQAKRRIEKTDNILSAVLLVTSNVKSNVPELNISSELLINKTEEIVFIAAQNYYTLENKFKIKDNLLNIIFCVNSLKLKRLISDDNHMSLIVAYSTIINAYETLEEYSKNNSNRVKQAKLYNIEGNSLDIIKDIDLKLEEVEELENFRYETDAESEVGQLERHAESFVETKTKKEYNYVKDKNNDNENKTHIKNINSISARIKDNAEQIKSQIDKKDIAGFENILNKRQDSRRNEILKILTRDPVTIKDISQKILGCSEKTIQRELNALLDDKLIGRIGEKRWRSEERRVGKEC